MRCASRLACWIGVAEQRHRLGEDRGFPNKSGAAKGILHLRRDLAIPEVEELVEAIAVRAVRAVAQRLVRKVGQPGERAQITGSALDAPKGRRRKEGRLRL